MNKKRYSTIPDQIQIERLKKYYDFNEETYTFSVPFHYSKVSDLFDDVVTTKSPKIKDEVASRIDQVLQDIPKGYCADFSLVIDDYEGYDPKRVLEAFNDLLKTYHYRYRVQSQDRYRKIAFLFVSGMAFILFLVLGNLRGWWGNGTSLWEGLVVFALDVLGYVLVWESVCHAAIHKPVELEYRYIATCRFSSLSLCEGNIDKVLVKENVVENINATKNPRVEKIVSFFLLIASLGFISVAIFSGTSEILDIITAHQAGTPLNLPLLLSLQIIDTLILIVLGHLCYRLYKGDDRFNILTGVLGAIAIGLCIYDYINIVAFEGMTAANIIALIIDIVIYLDFVIAYIFFLNYIKKNKFK